MNELPNPVKSHLDYSGPGHTQQYKLGHLLPSDSRIASYHLFLSGVDFDFISLQNRTVTKMN